LLKLMVFLKFNRPFLTTKTTLTGAATPYRSDHYLCSRNGW